MNPAKTVVVVESPAKAKTIKKYLGPGYEVFASYGHVRDLVAKEGAVQTEHNFAMRYEGIERNSRHVDAIAKAMRGADQLLLATDPDREGEAIAWHLAELLRERKVLADKPVHRVVFHEITQRAIQEAVDHPGEISMDLVNAQQARRALDYLVGFNISPLLWKKIRRGLSAGRVQSPALRLIVEREEEIEAFVPREYWTLDATVGKGKAAFAAKLAQFEGEKIEQFSVIDAERAGLIRSTIEQQTKGRLQVAAITRRSRKRNPGPPFITSTLQQEASKRFGFTGQRTMRIAQQLYEGIDIGSGPVGLITYMRTDSTSLAQEAVAEIRELIAQRFGSDTLPKSPNVFKTKSKNAQEAHEAIRPSSAARTPESVRAYLSADQLKLYTLVWNRTIACQMNPAVIDTVAVDLCPPGHAPTLLRATGSTVREPGFLAVYDNREDGEQADANLPALEVDELVELRALEANQHFTEPPPRFNEASLIKALEEFGIGRPSTYASIITTLQQREYVQLDGKRFMPTDVGRVVSRFLTEFFTQYVDYDFTARLEDELDAVSRGETEWLPVLERFWKPFHEQVVKTGSVERRDITQQQLDEACPECGKPLAIRLGKRGNFIGCTAYPECKYTRDIKPATGEPEPPLELLDRKCPECGGDLAYKRGRYGRFIGCVNYPTCKHVEPLNKPKDTGISCPDCKQGTLMERKSRYGKLFYSCSRYPDCKYAVWDPPVAQPCPKCGHAIMTIKTTKRRGVEKLCPDKACGYREPAPELAESAA
ncbi:type I DNA topoisomerase [Immundisolibacter cernigliae]|uniref:DNA topoisomerase 1 n=1 Tax=Immundisolibacter cernigliae TaxID=1810504 RepID=A0A1B1YUS8_9GAMM|nr:type I DNA topoisomerase [Immundisolibacter cernigliae]ANX04373.1 DNA topoisomerase I [Immundisolibacter cernigliae]